MRYFTEGVYEALGEEYPRKDHVTEEWRRRPAASIWDEMSAPPPPRFRVEPLSKVLDISQRSFSLYNCKYVYSSEEGGSNYL